MRRILTAAVAACLALLLASPWLALFVRGLPGVAIASSLAATASVVVAAWARRVRLPIELTTLLLLPPAVAWGCGEGLGFFARIPFWDAIAHSTAGLSLGVLGAATALRLLPIRNAPARRVAAVLAGLALAALAGSLWEVGEWTSDTLLGSNTLGSAADTVGDLAADLGGALLGGISVLVASRALPHVHRERLARPFRALSARSHS